MPCTRPKRKTNKTSSSAPNRQENMLQQNERIEATEGFPFLRSVGMAKNLPRERFHFPFPFIFYCYCSERRGGWSESVATCEIFGKIDQNTMTTTAAAAATHKWSDSALKSKQIEQYFKLRFFAKYCVGCWVLLFGANNIFLESPHYSLYSYALRLYGSVLLCSHFDICNGNELQTKTKEEWRTVAAANYREFVNPYLFKIFLKLIEKY